jgi:ABC-type sugar transport system ATPase subunit
MAPRIEFRDVSKKYPGVQALDGVSLSAAAGQIHALVGENGAGKSTLMRILAGATRADHGMLLLDGRPVEIRRVRDAQALGIAIVHQELSLVPDLSVGENVFLGRWPHDRWGRIDFGALHAKARQILETLGVELSVKQRVGALSLAGRQMVEIARALSLNARVLALDEPSAVLTPHELAGLFRLLRRLTGKGVCVLYISHRLDEVFELADVVTVLRDGRHVATRPVAEAERGVLIREMVGRPLAEEFPSRRGPVGPIGLRVSGLCSGRRFRDVTFDVGRGEVFALTGLVGSGRSSVGAVIFGAVPATGGGVWIGERIGPFRSPRAAKRAGIAFLPEDRKKMGLLLDRPIRENLTLAHLSALFRWGFLSVRKERGTAPATIRRWNIKSPDGETPAGLLSGGNQQKVLLARWLERTYQVIILDEPTRGVDVGARAEIYGFINEAARRGAAILMITSELPEAIGMADRIGVMSRGRLTGVLDNRSRNTSQETIMRLAVDDRPHREDFTPLSPPATGG